MPSLPSPKRLWAPILRRTTGFSVMTSTWYASDVIERLPPRSPVRALSTTLERVLVMPMPGILATAQSPSWYISTKFLHPVDSWWFTELRNEPAGVYFSCPPTFILPVTKPGITVIKCVPSLGIKYSLFLKLTLNSCWSSKNKQCSGLSNRRTISSVIPANDSI